MKIKFQWLLSLLLMKGAWGMDSGNSESLADYFPKHDYTRYDMEMGKGDPFLFEIRIPRSSVLPGIVEPHRTRFFLLGSQHNVPIEILQRATHYIAERSDVLITEVYSSEPSNLGDFDDISKEEMVHHGLINLHEQMDWCHQLSTDALKILQEKITPKTQKVWGVDAEHVSYAVIEEYLRGRERGWKYHHHHGMDNSLDDYFERKGKIILSLEDGKVRAQAGGTLEKLARKDLLGILPFLEQRLKNFDAVKISPKNMDVQSVQDYPSFFSGSLGEEMRSLDVINRNKAWVPTLKQHLIQHQTKTILICVGFGHFEGEESLLALLQNEGFDLIPVRKEGHTNPRLTSFCNYMMDYTYEDLLKEAAQEMILKRPLPPQETYRKMAQERYAKDYQEFLEILDFYQQPNAEEQELGPGGFSHSVIHQDLRRYCSLIQGYSMDPLKHRFFQRSNKGDYYLGKVFGTDLSFATSLIERKTYKAKENSYRKHQF